MENLFQEREVYEKLLVTKEKSKELSRLCYFFAMIFLNEAACEYSKEDQKVYSAKVGNYVSIYDIEKHNSLDERCFEVSEYYDLIEIFPNAKNILNENKFLES